ncbi:hypothetical protein EJB05_18419 [Eragrostis curvula]|uniref:Cytochrome c domain-containing protein n=1 Tax=Eragrostis curvula TaxID=38414 RepID=A0A5J9VJZ3_9POAL|nr:hypothetical protein EJB05_18419 [Eragrostis curvula]
MATARALSLGVLLVLALCLAACAGERQPTDGYVSYAGLPRAGGGSNARVPRGSEGSAILGRCKSCHGQPPTLAASKTAAAESKGAYYISHAALSADKYPSPTMTGAKTADKYPAPKMTGAKTEAAGPEGAYTSPAAVSEEKARYISYWALKHNQPSGKKCRRASSSCP